MKTTMVSKIGKKTSHAPYGMSQTLTLAALTMAMSKTCPMEQTHVILWSTLRPRLLHGTTATDRWKSLMEAGSTLQGVLAGSMSRERGRRLAMLRLSMMSSKAFPSHPARPRKSPTETVHSATQMHQLMVPSPQLVRTVTTTTLTAMAMVLLTGRNCWAPSDGSPIQRSLIQTAMERMTSRKSLPIQIQTNRARTCWMMTKMVSTTTSKQARVATSFTSASPMVQPTYGSPMMLRLTLTPVVWATVMSTLTEPTRKTILRMTCCRLTLMVTRFRMPLRIKQALTGPTPIPTAVA